MNALLEQLRTMWFEARRELDEAHDRTVPFADYVVDRWSRAREMGWGEGASVYDSCLVIGDVTVGANTWVGPNTVLDGSGGLVIGEHCSISAGSQIYTHSTVEHTITGGSTAVARRPTSIGNRTYIGPNVVVAMGVNIGSGSVIGAQSYVDVDIPDGVVAFGTPCRVRRDVTGDPTSQAVDKS